jgi:hypothetical protein
MERLAIAADTELAEEHIARGGELHRGGDQREQRREQEQQDRCERAVERVLDGELPALRIRPPEAQQREAPEMLQGRALVVDVEEPGNHQDVEAELMTAPDERHAVAVGLGGEGDDDRGCAGLARDRLEILRGAEQGDRRIRRQEVPDRIGVQEAHGAEPVLRLLQEPAGDVAAHEAGADDEGGSPTRPLGPPTPLCCRQGRSSGGDQQDGEQPGANRRGSGIGRRARGERQREHAHRRDGERPDDRRQLLEGDKSQARPVEAPQVERRHSDRPEGVERPGYFEVRALGPEERQPDRYGHCQEVGTGPDDKHGRRRTAGPLWRAPLRRDGVRRGAPGVLVYLGGQWRQREAARRCSEGKGPARARIGQAVRHLLTGRAHASKSLSLRW